MSTPTKITDGDHLLGCGATVRVVAGEATRLTVQNGCDNFTAMDQAEALLSVWFEFIEDDDFEEQDLATVVYTMSRLEAQPTHTFTDDREGSRLVVLREEDVLLDGGDLAKHTVALDRGSFNEGEDAAGWPPYLDGDVWRSSFDHTPIEGVTLVAVAGEPSA